MALPTFSAQRLARLLFPFNLGREQPRGWFPLDGTRIEFEATGFVIQLQTDPKLMPYVVLDPDGRSMAIGFNLQDLKAYAEKHARDRVEFQP